MTREALLKASIKEFEDSSDNALVWTCRRLFNNSGYCYIIKQESHPFSCALHYNISFDTSEEIGKYSNIEVAINTREQIPFESLIEYKGMHFAITSQGNYNETMKQWHYRGVGSFDPIFNQFLIFSEDEIDSNLGVNSMAILLGLQKDYPFVPSYFEAQSVKKYVMIDVERGENLGGSIKLKVDKLALHLSDNVKLTFVNFTRDECIAELFRIQQASLMPDSKFGLMSSPTLENKYIYQLAFNWKSLTYVSEFTINYYAQSSTEESVKHIKEALFEALEAL